MSSWLKLIIGFAGFAIAFRIVEVHFWHATGPHTPNTNLPSETTFRRYRLALRCVFLLAAASLSAFWITRVYGLLWSGVFLLILVAFILWLGIRAVENTPGNFEDFARA